MRSEREMLEIIIDIARRNNNILAVTMNGSRARIDSICDQYSDYDIQYIVKNIKPFLVNREWIEKFGEMLIMQEPEDWYDHPYDVNGMEPYAYLMQFADGNRIDLTLIDHNNMESFFQEKEPRKVIFNKEPNLIISEITSSNLFNINKPTDKEFNDIVNEYLWLSLYVLKGILRKELCYAKTFMDHYEIEMICKMISWKIGADNGFNLSTGKSYRYFEKYLTEEEMKEYSQIYSNCEYHDIKEKLLYSLKYFQKVSCYVAYKLNYKVDVSQMESVREYIEKMYMTADSD